MRHEWDYARGSDVCVNCKSTAQSVVQLGIWDCPGPKPAGNTGRHEDSILWDRLRADLNNLGAAYGELPEVNAIANEVNAVGAHWWDVDGVCVKCVSDRDKAGYTCFGTPLKPSAAIREAKAYLKAEAATSQRRDSETVEIKAAEPVCYPNGFRWITVEEARERYPDKADTESDLNLYYDGIILAARKKREAQNAFYDDLEARPLFSVRMARDEAEQEKLRPLAQAMARPLDCEPRVGWKPGDCE